MTNSDNVNQPNILLVVMDTARFSTIFSDSESVVMPTLEQIADEGTNFRQAMTTGPWTIPSHASMFTGLHSSDHNSHAGTKRFDPPFVPLAEQISKFGYRTGGFSNNTWLSAPFGFSRGFEKYHTRWELFEGGGNLASVAKSNGVINQLRALLGTLTERRAPLTMVNFLYALSLSYRSTKDFGANRTTRRLCSWIDDDQPFFGFVNYMESHLQYDPPTEYRNMFLPNSMDLEQLNTVQQRPWEYLAGHVTMNDEDFKALRVLYKAALRYLDDQLARLYEYLKKTDILDETVLIIVGDHGENIGEHGLMDHQYCLYDTLLHVPCVIRYPEEFTPGSSINELIELRDLFPTILELAKSPIPDHSMVSENSLVNPTERSVGRDYVIAEYMSPQPSMDALRSKIGDLPSSVKKYNRALRAIRTNRWKYIESSDGNHKLYDLRIDPTEKKNVASKNQDIVEDLQEQLEDNRGEFTPPTDTASIDVGANTKKRLEDLGYL